MQCGEHLEEVLEVLVEALAEASAPRIGKTALIANTCTNKHSLKLVLSVKNYSKSLYFWFSDSRSKALDRTCKLSTAFSITVYWLTGGQYLV